MTVGSINTASLPPLPPPATGSSAPKVTSAPTPAAFKVAAPAAAPTNGSDSDGDHDGSGGKVNVLA